MRQLLTHTAGWTGDYFADTGRGDDALTKMVESMAELEQVTPLGAMWSYNNAAFYLAGRVLEAVTETPYEVAIRELVLDPLGMTQLISSSRGGRWFGASRWAITWSMVGRCDGNAVANPPLGQSCRWGDIHGGRSATLRPVPHGRRNCRQRTACVVGRLLSS